MAGGRPTKYREEFANQAYKLCLLGATDSQLHDFFDVSEKTLNTWKIAHSEFLQSIKKSKAEYDANGVVNALLKRAQGFSSKEERIEFDNDDKQVRRTEITKDVPPDTGACFIWLKNRDSENWRDKPEGSNAENDIAEALNNIADKLPS